MEIETMIGFFVIIAIGVYVLMLNLKRVKNRSDSFEVERDLIPDEQKKVITKGDWSLSSRTIFNAIVILFELIIIGEIWEYVQQFKGESGAIIFFLVFLLILSSLISSIIKELKYVYSNQELKRGNYSITIQVLEDKRTRRGNNSTIYYLYISGLKGRHTTSQHNYERSRIGDEFYVVKVGTEVFLYNTLHYRLGEEESTRLIG